MRAGYKITLDIEAIKAQYAAGESQEMIAAGMFVGKTTIQRRMDEHGIPRRDKHAHRRKR